MVNIENINGDPRGVIQEWELFGSLFEMEREFEDEERSNEESGLEVVNAW